MATSRNVLVLGSGPIVIGQACEFDYAGTQALKALQEEGHRVVLLNSNPATIMTDPGWCDRTYIEPMDVAVAQTIVMQEKIDTLLASVGGQTALNLAMSLHDSGFLAAQGVTLLGASPACIATTEDRALFRDCMQRLGLDVPQSRVCRNKVELAEAMAAYGLPLVMRPSFTLGGSGGGIATSLAMAEQILQRGIMASRVGEVLVEESLLGWKEFELEMLLDSANNAIVVCSIENIDPMGVHTGDSITVAPAQTLTDREYQRMRNAALKIVRAVGLRAGGANIQFAIHPRSGRMIVIEMNPRVSRSSALASKATGYPIAKVATKLMLGYKLSDLHHDLNRHINLNFEPSIDYVVTKVPQFAFEKFPGADSRLGTQMKSVGEVMAMGRSFKESMFKAVASLERPAWQLKAAEMTPADYVQKVTEPGSDRLWMVLQALYAEVEASALVAASGIDSFFIDELAAVVAVYRAVEQSNTLDVSLLRIAKQCGLSDHTLANVRGMDETALRALRTEWQILPSFRRVDSCAAEFVADIPYCYSTHLNGEVPRGHCEAQPSANPAKVMILGSGPNRIGQGIEFDYCCSQAAIALRKMGYESIMVNSNPETVSTDYDTATRLYFEPLNLERVLDIVAVEKPLGVVVQLGGQTPLKLANALAAAGVTILGTSAHSLMVAEDRQLFDRLLLQLGIARPACGFASSAEQVHALAAKIGYPVLLRPSYVLGGRAMQVAYTADELQAVLSEALAVNPNQPLLVDQFLHGAQEFDVDALSDGSDCHLVGMMEHIEQAGIHSGDSCAVLPTVSLSEKLQTEMRQITAKMAKALQVVGFINVQFAVLDGSIYVLEVNPRASRTIPFVAKATAQPLVSQAMRLMLGEKLAQLQLPAGSDIPPRFCLKAPVFPFDKFLGFDPKLGCEMRSTGEVMGMHRQFGGAFYKAMLAAGTGLPDRGKVLLTVCERDHLAVVEIARALLALGFALVATEGTRATLLAQGLQQVALAAKNREQGTTLNCLDLIAQGQIAMIVNTPFGAHAQRDGEKIRTVAVQHRVPLFLTLSGAKAAILAMQYWQQSGKQLSCESLQTLFAV